jgi:hypothetical protein
VEYEDIEIAVAFCDFGNQLIHGSVAKGVDGGRPGSVSVVPGRVGLKVNQSIQVVVDVGVVVAPEIPPLMDRTRLVARCVAVAGREAEY